MSKRVMAKRHKCTQEEILKAIKGSQGIITQVAKRLGVSWDTAQRYIQANDINRTAFKNERESVLDLAESVIYKSITNGNTQDAKWLLSTLGKKRGYGEAAPQALDDENNQIKIVVVDDAGD